MNIAEAFLAFSNNPNMAPVQVKDSAAGCAASLDQLQALAAANKIAKVTISDTPSFSISYTKFMNCAAAIATLPATRRITVTAVPAAAAATLQANARVLSFSVTDSSAEIAKAFAGLNSRTRLSGIVLTDTNPLAVIASQYTASTFVRSLMPAGTRYVISKATTADAVALRDDTAVQSIAIADTSANILARLRDLAQTPAIYSAIKTTDAALVTMSQTMLLANAAAVTALGATLAVGVCGVDIAHLATVGGFAAVRSMTLADTAAAIAAAANDLNTAAKAGLKSVAVTDGRLVELTATTYRAVTVLRRVLDASARLSVSGVTAATAAATQADAAVATFTVRDTAANIVANLPALSASTKASTIALSSGTMLTLTADAYAANTAALSHLAGNISLTVNNATAAASATILADPRVKGLTLSDTWAGVRDNLNALNNDARISRIVLTDSAPVTMDVATYQANRSLVARLPVGNGAITITGLHANDVPAILANTRVGHVSVIDTPAQVLGNFDYLATLARAGTLTEVMVAQDNQTVKLTASDITAGAPALALMNATYSATTSVSPAAPQPQQPLFNLMWDSSVAAAPDGFVAAVEYAARSLDAMIATPMSLNIVISYGQVNNTALGSNALGSTVYNTAVNVSFAQLQDAYAHHDGSAATAAALANMTAPPNGAPVHVIAGQAKALGLLPGLSNGIDASIGFAADPSGTMFTYDPNARAVAGRYDFISVATHELSHALGRISVAPGIYTGLDMFRYSAPGVRAQAGTVSYFSMDGGVTRLMDFATKGNGDWASNVGADTFSASAYPGQRYNVSATDANVLASLGYRMADGAPAVDPNTINPSRGLGAPELSFAGTPDVTTIGDAGASLAFALKPAAGVHEIAGFQYGRDQLRLDTSAMPGNLIAYDSMADGRHAITLTSTTDTSFGVVLTGMGDSRTAGELMLDHLTKGTGQAMIA